MTLDGFTITENPQLHGWPPAVSAWRALLSLTFRWIARTTCSILKVRKTVGVLQELGFVTVPAKYNARNN